MGLRKGKVPVDLLEQLLRHRGAEDSSVRVGPEVGEDAAAVDLGDQYLILKTDPVTFAVDEIGWYAVHINANDVATMGARPRWFQITILLPKGSAERLVRGIYRQVHEACTELDVAITGGHTEVTATVNQVVLVGDMHGLVSKENLVMTSGAQEGDVLILTKAAGIEGTAILARERAGELRGKFDDTLLMRAANFLRSPGISVVSEALLAAEIGATALHDPTEGGVAMGLYEMSKACGRELEVEPATIRVEEETRVLCEFYGLNPLGLIGSGSLLVAIPGPRSAELLAAYARMGAKAVPIGRVARRGEGIRIEGERGQYPLEPSEADEITKVL